MEQWKILVVDDEQDVHDVSRLAFKRVEFRNKTIQLLSAFSTNEARTIIEDNPDIALVLLDIVMEEDNSGLELVKYIREVIHNEKIQIIIRTGHPGHAPVDEVIFKYEVNDYQEKSELTSYKLRTSVITALRAYESLSKIDSLYNILEESQYDLFYSLGQIAESRSKETGNHVKRVGEIARIIARAIGFSKHDAKLLKHAASMHDIGKLAIPDSIINKPGKLTSEEFDVIKTHSEIGYEMLISSNKEILHTSAIIAREHHENYDGTGYPRGLVKNDIHINSRIVAIADVFDALGNKRIYKTAWELEDILSYMRNESGKKFDPKLVDVLFENIDEINKVRSIYPD